MNDEQVLQLELDALVKYSSSNILITDGVGQILRASPNSLAIYGLDDAAMIGRSVFEFEQKGIFSPSVTAKVMDEKQFVQVMQRTKTGRTVMASGFPVLDEWNHIIRIISFSTDLTEIQNLKEDYEELNSKVARYETEIEQLREYKLGLHPIILQSNQMNNIVEMIQRVAKTEANIVFLGESGVGKTMFAQLVHKLGNRVKEAFIEINCSAIPEALFESELFGYEGGAFTGANKAGKPGLIELAHNGTLFLDEIGELPLSMQAKLLKVIQEKKVTRIGGTKPLDVNFRLIVATNQDLDVMVKHKLFREDLYYRLNVITIMIPPLRNRKEDIGSLAQYYLAKNNKKYKEEKVLHPATIEALISYDWPGNARELQNVIERLVITTNGRTILPENVPMLKQPDRAVLPATPSFTPFLEEERSLKDVLESVERQYVQLAFEKSQSTYEMANRLGIHQSNVVRKMKKYGINAKSHL